MAAGEGRFSPELPGFLPDAIPFALRTVAALLLAYAVAFVAQIQAASTAGICVAIVAQPSAGMAFSKAEYRMLGTVCGGIAGVVLLGLFPQDRTMLLMGYALWLGACAFVGTLLRDFRSYGAVLSGYTAGVIALAAIDAPQAGFLAAMDRVAAIGVGVLSVLLVNTVFAGTGAFRGLLDSLRTQASAVTAVAMGALRSGTFPDDLDALGTANAISALRAQATFAGRELPDGRLRANGAGYAIEALLALLSTSRTLAGAVGADTAPSWRRHLDGVAAALDGGPAPGNPPPVTDPTEALLQRGTAGMLALHARVKAGLRTLEEGGTALPRTVVRVSYDQVGALLGAFRSVIAIGLIAVFTVCAGWADATLLLIQGTAIVALLGATPNPTQASMPFAWVLPPMALAVGVAKFLLLPLASGFVPFALTIGTLTFATALLVRHRTLSAFGAPALLFLTLLLSPANPQAFSLTSYVNTVLELALSVVFVLLTFRLILPVSPKRRLWRVAAEIARHWRGQAGTTAVLPPSLFYDRMSRVRQWLGRPTPARLAFLGHLYAAGELDRAEREARAALLPFGARPELIPLADAARHGLDTHDPALLLSAGQALLELRDVDGAAERAASGLSAVALALRRAPDLVRFGDRLAA